MVSISDDTMYYLREMNCNTNITTVPKLQQNGTGGSSN